MELSKTGRAIALGIVALFVIAMAAIVATSATRGPVMAGPFQGKLKQVEELGLNSASIAPQDVYGEEAFAFTNICPGIPRSELEGAVDTTEVKFENDVVAKDVNYLLVFKENGEVLRVEEFDNSHIDVCAAGLLNPVPAVAAIPLIKTGEDFWQIAV